MPIPLGITREHILQAIQRVDNEGFPNIRRAKSWAVLYNGEQYPCKILISWANVPANGYELRPNPIPQGFTTDHAREYLSEKGFQIIPI